MNHIITAALTIGFYGLILQRYDLLKVSGILIGIAFIVAIMHVLRGEMK